MRKDDGPVLKKLPVEADVVEYLVKLGMLPWGTPSRDGTRRFVLGRLLLPSSVIRVHGNKARAPGTDGDFSGQGHAVLCI